MAFIVFALAAEATTLWLIVAGSVIAVLFVISAMVLAYGWAQKRFQDDVEF
jgi:TRAP-type C4-dicarboxylate transport system permease large subunit